MGATLWANKTLNPGMTFGPEDGKIELDTLEIYSELPTDDVSSQYHDTFTGLLLVRFNLLIINSIGLINWINY